jgi:diaminopimelate decarboxylase
MMPTLQAMFDLAARSDDVDYVNIGGGVGVDYSRESGSFDYRAFGAEVCAMARQAAERRPRPFMLLFEPGRSLVASSGVFITRVTDVKSLAGSRLVVVDASVSLFPRPYHHPGNYHHVRVLDAAPGDVETVTSTIVGRTTFSRDILGVYSLPRSLRVGSLLAFDDAGAYCESMMSRFLGQRYPTCYVSEE